jgi:site-specific DNA-cytosine methylase
MSEITIKKVVRHGHIFCGLGSGARGFNMGQARVGSMEAVFECVGGIDVDAAGVRDFETLTGTKATVRDLFSFEQYVAFHGQLPPPGWTPALPHDIHAAFGFKKPHIIFLSAPCKGFSGLLSETTSKTDKYQALNELTVRGMMLALEAYADDPVELFIFENVPRIAKRGRKLLNQITGMLRAYGYAVSETTHDCGEIGNLAQSRKRFLLVARHEKKVPPFLYEPPKRGLRGVGEILDRMPLPGDERAGPMHRIPALQWQTWVRLAFVEAGSDWRSLNKLAVEDGHLKDFGIVPDGGRPEPATDVRPGDVNWNSDVLGVRTWDEHTGVVAGRSSPTNGANSVADPRFDANGYEAGQYGVRGWKDTTGAIINVKSTGQGGFAVSDPRVGDDGPRFSNVYKIVRYGDASGAVTSARGGMACVADPRHPAGDGYEHTKYLVTPYSGTSRTVISASTTGDGAFAVADPRPVGLNAAETHRADHYGVQTWDDHTGAVLGNAHPWDNGRWSVADPRPVGLAGKNRDTYANQGHYGVIGWDETSKAIPAYAKNNNGSWSVADPREAVGDQTEALPTKGDRLVCVIRSLDGTWHRPFTTLDLAGLQSFFEPEEAWGFTLDGKSDSAWRERIGNAVPSDAAAAIASVMGKTLLLAWSGQTFMLSTDPIWVAPQRQLMIALSVDTSSMPL